MSPQRPPSPRSSGSGSARPGGSSGRSTRPASGQVPSSTDPRKPSAARGTPRGSTSQDSEQRHGSKSSAHGAQRPSAARPNPQKPGIGSATRPRSAPAGTSAAGNSGSRTARGSSGNSTSQRQSGPDTQSVSAYSVGAPLNRSFGFLQTTGARVVTFMIVLGICAVILTPVLRNYFKQYNANNAIKAEISKQQAINDQLRNELDRWQDDKYVIAQARERLTFVFPGESPYRVMGWDSQEIEELTESSGPALFPDQDMPWYENLWQSVQKTGSLSDESASAVKTGTQSGGQEKSKDGADAPSDTETESGTSTN